MISEKNRLIIFNTDGNALGEIVFNHDLFLQAILYPAGEEVLGGCLEDWQVKGILYFHPDINLNSSISTMGEYVTMHDPVFPSALRQWLEHHDLYSTIIPESSWDIWNDIALLPLTPEEQFRLGMRLSNCNQSECESLKKSLGKLISELDKSQKPVKAPSAIKKPKTSSGTKKTKKATSPKKAKVKAKK